MSVRTRIAPSPTGDPHLGTAYVALFSHVFARRQGGKVVLRMEDTDRVRSSGESERKILETLKWLGLNWDEGPDVGGPNGPYRQSERGPIYREHVDRLLADGNAFHCFCAAERLALMRRRQQQAGETTRYDGHCLQFSRAQVEEKLRAGEQSVVRMRVPDEGVCTFTDRLRGEISIDWRQIDMQVLLKADGMPTYHLAVVVDDHAMGISHIIRGEEWISSVPKHQRLCEYFGWSLPELIHLPLLRNPDKSKLSKRRNPTGIGYYRRLGFLPEALLNYLGRMGFSLPDEEEKFSLARMTREFDWSRVSLGAPVFDLGKLEWLNGRWIREELDDDAFAERVADWALNPAHLRPFIPLVKDRLNSFSQLVPLAGFLLSGELPLREEDFNHARLDLEQSRRILQYSSWRLDELRDWRSERLAADLKQLAAHLELGMRDFLFPLFVAVTGGPVSLPLFDSMAVLGPDLTRARLRQALAVLGAPSKKRRRQLEKEYAGIRFD